jgi:hypothetical protein
MRETRKAEMAIPTHGVRQIRTLPTVRRSRAPSHERHVHQFRLAALELERSRLLHEKQAAERRLDGILGRLAKIQHKMRQHRELLERDEAVEEPSAPRAAPRILRY